MKLSNPQSVGIHLRAGAADGYITSADQLVDETRGQSIQKTLDELAAGASGEKEYASAEDIDALFTKCDEP
jgi:hypothetical protein